MRSSAVPLLALILAACSPAAADPDDDDTSPSPETRVVDGHVHLSAELPNGSSDYAGAAEAGLAEMDRLDIDRAVLMPTPFAPGWDHVYDADPLVELVDAHPDRFAFVAGGGSLNPDLHRAVAGESVDPVEFAETARSLLERGAVGFGEIAAEHVVIGGTEPYLHAPANHPLLEALADVAAEEGVFIDLHMEAVEQDMDLQKNLAVPPNPDALEANIDALEELLDHNPAATILWSHAGWGISGQRTAALSRRLLDDHDNLMLGIKITGEPVPDSAVDGAGVLYEDWRSLLEDHADRFVLGSDQFWVPPQLDLDLPNGAEPTRRLLDQLDPDVAAQIGWENAAELYGF